MKERGKFFNVGNDFYQDKLEELKRELEKGETIEVSVNCIGHTRNNMTQEAYKEELIKCYGTKLIVNYNDGVCSYSYSYRLKENK